MDQKKSLLEELRKRTTEQDIEENELFTAQSLADAFGIGRNTISQYLNVFVKQEKVIKVNSRPVYFFDRSALEKKWNVYCNQAVYRSIDELNQLNQKVFQKLIGYDGSLKSVVEQCKAAIAYPDHGLPILLYGPTGTGKVLLRL